VRHTLLGILAIIALSHAIFEDMEAGARPEGVAIDRTKLDYGLLIHRRLGLAHQLSVGVSGWGR